MHTSTFSNENFEFRGGLVRSVVPVPSWPMQLVFLQPLSCNLFYCTLGVVRHLLDEEFVQFYTVTPGAANG